MGVDCWFCPRPLPVGCRYSGQTDKRLFVCGRFVLLDHKQHVLPILQLGYLPRLYWRDDPRQLHDPKAFLRQDQRSDLRDADRRRPQVLARILEQVGRDCFLRCSRCDYCRVFVFPRINTISICLVIDSRIDVRQIHFA